MANYPAPVPPWTSPIRWLMPYVPGAPYAIAPEKAQALHDLVGKSVTLRMVEDDSFVCEIDLRTGEVSVSSFLCELCWVAAYAYTCIYEEVFMGHLVTEELNVDLASDPRTAPASRLLQWAYEKWVNAEATPWPEDLPRPTENPQKGSREFTAKELALAALGVLIHHECAHKYLEHRDKVDLAESQAQEKDADAHAIDMILGGIASSDSRFDFRGLAIALAYAVLSNKGVHTGSAGLQTHPRRFDRLYNAVARYVDDPNHRLWGVVVVWIKIHLDNSRIGTPDPPEHGYATFKQCASAYIDHLAKHLTWDKPREQTN
jgi:Peptidase U49